MKKVFLSLTSAALVCTLGACGGGGSVDKGTLSNLQFNMAFDSEYRTMTYNQNYNLQINGYETVTKGDLKPVWQQISKNLDVPFKDVTNQAHSATQMMSLASANGFTNAHIYGGNGIAEQFMTYGAQGKFVDLNDYLDDMDNFRAFLDANPDVKTSITAYDGGIYHVPYVSEMEEIARTYNLRGNWVEVLFGSTPNYDTSYTSTYTKGYVDKMGSADGYTPYFDGSTDARTRQATVSPKPGVNITKKTTQNIITLQNNLSVKNGKTLTETFVKYIEDNYDYSDPSELFLGAKAAYDMDELVALLRCVKANPNLLSSKSGVQKNDVYPFFVRQSTYREDLLRFATYFNSARLYGSDSYTSTWEFNAEGQVEYTYSQEDTYEALTYIQKMYTEGLIHADSLTSSNKDNYRIKLYGSDSLSNAEYGFMSFDWIASSTADNLNEDVVVVLPPVAPVNGEWQYYIDNARTIKPDGWAISSASNIATIEKAVELFDYMFSEEGSQLQNYGIDEMLEDEKTTIQGVEYPKFTQQVIDLCDQKADGDLSTFLRDHIGALMAVGFQKEIGFEYQYTSTRGFDGVNLIEQSNTNIPSYLGLDKNGNTLPGTNKNYYKLVPATFSLSKLQQDDAKGVITDTLTESVFNVVRKSSGYAQTYEAYYALYANAGIVKYQSAYQAAYRNMLLG